jgi:5'-3' exonuclease
VIVHLLDGTYELFRHHFGRPDPGEFGATSAVLSNVLTMLTEGATHIGVASDHVIESFRNDLWPGYKTSEGMPPELLMQTPVVESALEAMGVTTWRMVEYEADDALAAAATVAADDERVDAVIICTPDKDLAQCVVGTRIVQLDRRKDLLMDADGVRAKFGVLPESIPDYLALVGDSADGFPGLPGWGAKSAAAVLATYVHLEAIPPAAGRWDVPGLRGAAKLSAILQDQFADALLFRRLATLERDVEVGSVDDWRWEGPSEAFAEVVERIGAPHLLARARRIAANRTAGTG